jgi:hypothetical protein
MAADRRLRRLRCVLPSLLPFLLLPAAAAHAGGLPPTSLDAGPEGVLDHTGDHRFTATPLATTTVLTKSDTHGGRVLRASVLRGRWGVPVVANDATSGGLSADGRTLVLTRVATGYPRTRTSFAVIGTARMALRDTVHLNGEWHFDAASPNGRRVHLIEHRDRLDPTRTALRTYDLERDRFLATADRIRGHPITRTTGQEGRWAYTLYAGRRLFIHVLDTATSTSHRLDLPEKTMSHRRLWALRLAVRRNRVAVLHGDHIVASAARRPRRASAGGGPPWLAVAVAVTGLALAVTATRKAQATSRRSRELR